MLSHALGRLALAAVAAAAAFVAGFVLADLLTAVVSAWAVLAVSYVVLTWHALKRLDPAETRTHALRDERGRQGIHAALVVASVASLAGVALLLMAGDSGDKQVVPVEALVGVASIGASWALVHMIYVTRYARAYYESTAEKPVDFAGTGDPDYQDFAYLSYTLGMTFQVSDTTLGDRTIRRLALRHCLLAYLLGAVVIASTINLVVTLASSTLGGGH